MKGRRDINKFSPEAVPSLLSGCSADTDSKFAFDPGLNICSHTQKKPNENTKQPNLCRLNDCGFGGTHTCIFLYR